MPVSEVTGDFKGGLTEEKGIEERTDETVAARGRTDGVLGATPLLRAGATNEAGLYGGEPASSPTARTARKEFAMSISITKSTVSPPREAILCTTELVYRIDVEAPSDTYMMTWFLVLLTLLTQERPLLHPLALHNKKLASGHVIDRPAKAPVAPRIAWDLHIFFIAY